MVELLTVLCTGASALLRAGSADSQSSAKGLTHTRFLGILLVAVLWFNCMSLRIVHAAEPRSFVPAVSDEKRLTLECLDELTDPLLEEPGRKNIPLDLQGCVHRALENNLDIRVGSYSPGIQITEVVRAEAAFDAVLFASTQLNIEDRANDESGYFTRTTTTTGGHVRDERIPTLPFDENHTQAYTLGLRKRLATGADIQLSQSLQRLNNLNDQDQLYLNPFHEFALQLQISQPLLRDFGIDLNRASIEAARNNYRITCQEFHLLVIRTVAEVETNYWRLVTARQQMNVFLSLLREAQATKAKLLERRTLDTSTELLAQIDALLQRARAGIVRTRNSILLQQDRLLESLNDPELSLAQQWEIVPTVPPSLAVFEIVENQALQTALQLRPEIISQRVRLDTAGIALGVAKNQALPRLDLIARQEVSGAGSNDNSAWERQWHGDAIDYGVGLTLEIPIGNRGQLASLRRAKAEQRQEQARLKSIREQILADVRIAAHDLTHAYQEVNEQRKIAQAEAYTLEAYEAQEDAETGTTPGFLDRKIRAQERFANALLTLAQSISRYNVAIMDMQRAQGSLLRYDNIKIGEAP